MSLKLSMTSSSGLATTSRLSTCLLAGRAEPSEIHLARRKLHFARLLAVHVHGRAGIQVFQAKGDAAAGPLLGHADLALVPGRGDARQVRALPARMGVDRLAVLLHVVG